MPQLRDKAVNRSVRFTKTGRLKEWFAFVDLCFMSLDEPDLKEISNKTGLCLSTLYRLRHHNFTLAVHVGTVEALGLAAGLKLTHTKHGHRVIVVS